MRRILQYFAQCWYFFWKKELCNLKKIYSILESDYLKASVKSGAYSSMTPSFPAFIVVYITSGSGKLSLETVKSVWKVYCFQVNKTKWSWLLSAYVIRSALERKNIWRPHLCSKESFLLIFLLNLKSPIVEIWQIGPCQIKKLSKITPRSSGQKSRKCFLRKEHSWKNHRIWKTFGNPSRAKNITRPWTMKGE